MLLLLLGNVEQGLSFSFEGKVKFELLLVLILI